MTDAGATGPGRARRWSRERLAERASTPLRPCDTPLVVAAVAVAAGVVAEPALGAVGLSPIWLVGLSAISLLGWFSLRRSRRDHASAAALLVSIAMLTASWSAFAWRSFPTDDLGRFAYREAEPVALEVVALEAPTFYPADDASPFRAIPSSDRSVLPVRVERLRDGVAWRDAGGVSQVTTIGKLAGVAPGDRLRVYGQLRRPTPAMNPGERDAARAALAERRLSVVWSEAVECVSVLGDGPRAANVSRAAERTRDRLRTSIVDRLPDDEAAVVSAMLLGDRSALREETVDAFRRTGTLHVLVVSGLHMGLVAASLLLVASAGLAPKRPALVLCVAAVIGYALLTGAAPPATRAAILAGAACVATLFGRRALGANSLAGGAIAVFAASPGAWESDGTRLSFLSAATLLAVARFANRRATQPKPPLERLIEQSRAPVERFARGLARWAGWLLFASAAVLIVTGPLLASRFHLLSPIAVPLSVVVLPLVWLIVGSGLVMAGVDGALGGWAPAAVTEPLVGGFEFVCRWCSGALIVAVERAAEVPGASFFTPGPAWWWVALWYALVGCAAAVAAYRPRAWGLVARGALAVFAAAFIPALARVASDAVSGDRPLRCSFLAVGHGAATLLESPGGGTILCDAGALGAPDRVADTIARVLWSRGVTRLDAVVLSHADVDHYNAVPGLLERFRVGEIWTSELMLPRLVDDTDHSGPAELRRVIEASGVPIRTLRTGDHLRFGESGDDEPIRIEVLHPSDLGVAGSDNANSLVLGVEHRGRRLLLTGDLESPGLDLLLQQEPYDCDVLVAPHHGSARSDPPGLANWCRPEFVVISSGGPHPGAGAAYQEAGAVVMNTHQTGMLTVDLDRAAPKTPFRPQSSPSRRR